MVCTQKVYNSRDTVNNLSLLYCFVLYDLVQINASMISTQVLPHLRTTTEV